MADFIVILLKYDNNDSEWYICQMNLLIEDDSLIKPKAGNREPYSYTLMYRITNGVQT